MKMGVPEGLERYGIECPDWLCKGVYDKQRADTLKIFGPKGGLTGNCCATIWMRVNDGGGVVSFSDGDSTVTRVIASKKQCIAAYKCAVLDVIRELDNSIEWTIMHSLGCPAVEFDVEQMNKIEMTTVNSSPVDANTSCFNCGECEWSEAYDLPKVGQTYKCGACGEVVYGRQTVSTGFSVENQLEFRPVTTAMLRVLLFAERVGKFPSNYFLAVDQLLEELPESQAIDYWMCVVEGYSQTEWAKDIGVTPQSVSRNVRLGKEVIVE